MNLRSLLAVAALSTCTAGAAMAADLPMRSPPPAPFYPAPIFTWTGFYIGANAGASFDNRAGSLTPTGFVAAGLVNASPNSFRGGSDDVGFVGGGQIGYNVQNGMFVYGLEADADFFGGQSGSSTTTANLDVYTAPGSTRTITRRSGDGFLGTVRGRLGVAAFDRTLLYVTGGLAYGNYGTSYARVRYTNGVTGAVVDFNSADNHDVRVGYALGAGVEYALTQQISAKAEYLYTNLGSRRYALTNPSGASLTAHTDGSAQIARVGINYKF